MSDLSKIVLLHGKENKSMCSNGGNAREEDSEDLVTPWTVLASSVKGINYDRLIGDY